MWNIFSIFNSEMSSIMSSIKFREVSRWSRWSQNRIREDYWYRMCSIPGQVLDIWCIYIYVLGWILVWEQRICLWKFYISVFVFSHSKSTVERDSVSMRISLRKICSSNHLFVSGWFMTTYILRTSSQKAMNLRPTLSRTTVKPTAHMKKHWRWMQLRNYEN